MKVEKLPSGSYKVKPQYNGKRYSLTFDHKPTEREIGIVLAEKIKEYEDKKEAFETCANSYIDSKSNVLSPSTIKGYKSLLDNSIPDDFKRKKISKITQIDIQLLINDYAVKHKPKTVRNLHGFISAVLRQFRPNMIISTTLPQKSVNEPKVPALDDIKRILDICDPQFTVALRLAMLGMRRSEICAAELSDIEGNTLHINKALVLNDDNEWVVKATKTAAGTRDIYIPDDLLKMIQDQGYVYKGWPNSIYDALQNYCAKLNIEPFRLHDLRHFYASYAHSKGMSDADIMASGGWKSDYTMKSIYRHEMKDEKEKKQKEIAASFFS